MSKRTHIWLITTDQMRADALGIENASVLTPELDKLASEGTLFTRAYCASPVCTPSRSSIFTGRYPHVHGETFHKNMKNQLIAIAEELLMEHITDSMNIILLKTIALVNTSSGLGSATRK